MKTALFTVLILTIASSPALADNKLAKSKQCFSCHAVDKEVRGPSFQAIAKLHKGTPKADATLASKIQKGGAEHWGKNVMPSAEARGVKISDAEAKKLAKWVLTH